MKKPGVLLILIFSFCISKGQNNSAYGWQTGEALSSIIKIPGNDTLKVVMLISDSSGDRPNTAIGYGKFTVRYNNTLWWQYGYKVYDYKNEEILYLDEQKNRLPKSVIVWEDIEK